MRALPDRSDTYKVKGFEIVGKTNSRPAEPNPRARGAHESLTVPTDDLTRASSRPRKTASGDSLIAYDRKRQVWIGFVNDPSAGSPTETLLRLLLPLNDQV